MVADFRSVSGNNSFVSFSNNASTADQVRLGSTSGNLVLSTNYTERMRITSSGNVGIGTTIPSEKLEVVGKILTTANSTALAAGYFATLSSDYATDTLKLTSKVGDVFRATNYGRDVSILTGATTTTEKMRILANGNVGIGTDNPAKLLEVKSSTAYNSTVRLSTTAHNWDIQGGETGYSSTAFALDYDGTTFFRAMGTTDARFGGGLSVGTINATPPVGGLYVAGNVGIGTTSPSAKLHLEGDAIIEGVLRADNVNLGLGGAIKLKASNTSSDQYVAFGTTPSGSTGNATFTEKMRIGSNGNVGIGTTAPSQLLHVAGNMRLQNQLYDSTNSIGTSGQVLTKTSAGTIWADNRGLAPTTPGGIVATIVGETIEIAFNQSTTSNIDYYQVWSSDDGGDYGIIGQIAPSDFSSTMTVVDTTFVTGGTMSYRVYAVKSGVYSPAGTVSKAYTVSALSVTNMTVVNLNTAYYIQYEKPLSRFIDHVEIYMDSQTTSAALNRSNASIVYSGQNASYMRNVGTNNNFHQFWVEIVTS
jgi:hypothetical protein